MSETTSPEAPKKLNVMDIIRVMEEVRTLHHEGQEPAAERLVHDTMRRVLKQIAYTSRGPHGQLAATVLQLELV